MPCRNNATCVALNNNANFYCQCSKEYTGSTCCRSTAEAVWIEISYEPLFLATPVTTCPPDYCKNNGQCTFDYTLNRLRCACPGTFGGQYCEIPIGKDDMLSFSRRRDVKKRFWYPSKVNRICAPAFLVTTMVAAHQLEVHFSAPAKIHTMVLNVWTSTMVGSSGEKQLLYQSHRTSESLLVNTLQEWCHVGDRYKSRNDFFIIFW